MDGDVAAAAPGDARSDALLPGAVLVGAVLTGMQAIATIYLPDKLGRASALYGAIGTTVVTLGWFFFVARAMVFGMSLDAVIYERFGSISQFVFGLPLVRALPVGRRGSGASSTSRRRRATEPRAAAGPRSDHAGLAAPPTGARPITVIPTDTKSTPRPRGGHTRAWPARSSTILAWPRSTTRSTPTAATSTSTSPSSASSGRSRSSTSAAAPGTFACMLAQRGIDVTAVDPSGPSLDMARTKPGAEPVRWLLGDATNLPPLEVDAAFMTANVAQVFLTDEAWSARSPASPGSLRPQGWLVFETRDPARRGWEEWTPARTHAAADVPGVGLVESWQEVVDVSGQLVTFRSTTMFRATVRRSRPRAPCGSANAPTWRRLSCAVASKWSRYATLPTGPGRELRRSFAAAPPDAAVPRPRDTTS